MFNSNEHKGHILGSSHLYVTFGFREFGHAICQEVAKTITWNDKDGQIDFALEQFGSQMNEIHRHDIATT